MGNPSAGPASRSSQCREGPRSLGRRACCRDGDSLSHWRQPGRPDREVEPRIRRRFTARGFFRLSIELAYGLAHIHLCGILYRDLQPRNVLFDEWDTLRLVDFDTAVLLGDPHPNDMSHHSVINYMAPELLDGKAADGRADLYSLGATMYEMVAGHPAFPGGREEVLSARQAGQPPALHREGLPEGLAQLIFGLLSPERNERPHHAYEVAGCLEQLRAAHAKIQRLLDSDLDRDVLKTLETFLAVDGASRISPAPGESRLGVFMPNVDLPPDHRLLMQAIMALAEGDYRRAAIDAGTASEVNTTDLSRAVRMRL